MYEEINFTKPGELRKNSTVSECFSVTKEEVPDNEQEKGTEKETTERVGEDAEMVRRRLMLRLRSEAASGGLHV